MSWPPAGDGVRPDSSGSGSSASGPSPAPPRRVSVTSPRMRPRRAARPTAAREIDEQTELGEVYIRSLMRAQLRLGVFLSASLATLLGGLPLLLAGVPGLRGARVLGVPLPWLLLGVAVYPVLVGAGWLYVRQAERNERDFAALVKPDEREWA